MSQQDRLRDDRERFGGQSENDRKAVAVLHEPEQRRMFAVQEAIERARSQEPAGQCGDLVDEEPDPAARRPTGTRK